MNPNEITPQELWSRQQISCLDVDYNFWNKKRESIQGLSRISQSCVFTVDVFKERYDFASDNFSHIFGYNPAWIRSIRQQGDLLEERIHPDDRAQMAEYQIEHGLFIYSLSPYCRNDYQQIFQIRILNEKRQYVNVVSRQQVIQEDKNGKAWIIMGVMDISPDQIPSDKVKRTVVNLKTGEILTTALTQKETLLTKREKDILQLIHQGLLSKEIACKLDISIYTVNNHRKSILRKLEADNSIEAINFAKKVRLID